MKVYLKRNDIREKICDGYFCSEDGTYICDTVEATPYMLERGEYDQE